MITGHRLRVCKISHLRQHEDLTNAFMCPKHSDMAKAAYDIVELNDLRLFIQLFNHSAVCLKSADGTEMIVVPGVGGLMGNPSIVSIFSHAYKKVVAK